MLLDQDRSRRSLIRSALAWCVHLFTASGALWGLLAIEAVYRYSWRDAFLWMTVAVAVDAIDGSFARWVRVKQVLPNFDGTLLDNIIDYLNYVVVPALLLYQVGLVPPGLSLATSAGIALASAYQFCQGDAKTEDHYFRGFPSYWNIAVFYLLLLGLPGWLNLAILVLLIVLIFVPIKYIYPTRTKHHQRSMLLLTTIWAGMMVAVLARFENPPRGLLWGSLLYVAYYFGASLHVTFFERPAEPEAEPVS